MPGGSLDGRQLLKALSKCQIQQRLSELGRAHLSRECGDVVKPRLGSDLCCVMEWGPWLSSPQGMETSWKWDGNEMEMDAPVLQTLAKTPSSELQVSFNPCEVLAEGTLQVPGHLVGCDLKTSSFFTQTNISPCPSKVLCHSISLETSIFQE